MPADSFKILYFMKRRPGMSLAEFQDYYENHHAPLCAQYASGLKGYQRRFLTALVNPETGANDELPFDVITELRFDDENVFRKTVAYLTSSKMPEVIVEDEQRLFDRAKTRMATVVERASALGQ